MISVVGFQGFSSAYLQLLLTPTDATASLAFS
jgi:hypothetical protein